MIETAMIGGRPASVVYLDDALEPVDSQDAATLVKVIFTDDKGGVVFLVQDDEAKQRKWDESEHPRVPAGSPEGGQFGHGGGAAESSKPEAKPEKKKVKKEDFDKAKIDLSADDEQELIDNWNKHVGMDPEDFKKEFLGGVDATMTIHKQEKPSKFGITGRVLSGGRNIGVYDRVFDIENKLAYSAYFKITDKDLQGKGTGKKVLKGNIDVYEKLGIETVRVSAGLDVGGYAWAKYGYVPTQSSWNDLRNKIARKLGGGRGRGGGDGIVADDWDMLSEQQQQNVYEEWLRTTHDEFLESEVQNWRESGQALEQAKRDLAFEYERSGAPDWFTDALNDVVRDEIDIPYTNEQLYKAIAIAEYQSRYDDGQSDPEISFDDSKLQEPENAPPKEQGTLPGIEPEDLSARLTEDMREALTTALTKAFNDASEFSAERADPPEYLADSIQEYQESYWEGSDDSYRLDQAIRYDMANIEIEEDDDDVEPPSGDPLLDAVESNNPKSLWKIADSPRGEELLLGSGWAGVLNLKDKETMDRFNKYVGRKPKEPQRAAA